MKYPYLFPCTLGVLLLVLASMSCASRPDADLKFAQTAMDEAQAQQAADFAPVDWQDAIQVWKEAHAALADGSYANAKALLIKAKARFEKSGAIAKSKRADVLNEVQVVQTTLRNGLDSLKTAVARSSLSASGRKEFDDAVKEVEAAIGQFNTEVDKGALAQARASGQNAIKKLNEVQLKLASVSKS